MRILLSAACLLFGMMASALAQTAGPRLPLGDLKITATPRAGYVMACQTRFSSNGHGAFRTGKWIGNGTWDPAGKPVVQGQVNWPNARISITVQGGKRIIQGNGLPTHATGIYPIQYGTAAYDYDRNPNHISEQAIDLVLPAVPSVAASATCVPMGMVGVATSGAAIYNAFDETGRDAVAYEIQDSCNGHPHMTGQYHYHGWSPCLAASRAEQPVGWMLDGFPILGPVDGNGRTIADADLDACHGRVGPVLIDGKLVTMYHYNFTREYPYTIGCFRGVVDTALLRRGMGPPGMPPMPGQP